MSDTLNRLHITGAGGFVSINTLSGILPNLPMRVMHTGGGRVDVVVSSVEPPESTERNSLGDTISESEEFDIPSGSGELWVRCSSPLATAELSVFQIKPEKAAFMLVSEDIVSISTDPDNASIITGLTFEYDSGHWQLEAALGGIRNISGRTIAAEKGLISSHVVSTNSSTKILFIYSERSTDGVNWTKNPLSGRTESVSGSAESYGSKSSEAFVVLDQEIIRFRIFSGGANVTLSPVSFVVDGEIVTGPSTRWRLSEL